MTQDLDQDYSGQAIRGIGGGGRFNNIDLKPVLQGNRNEIVGYDGSQFTKATTFRKAWD